MKNVIWKYGLRAAFILIILDAMLVWFTQNGYVSMGWGEVIGYASMLIALSFIFLGIIHYRDQHENGSISFAKALRVGIFISLIASALYGIYTYALFTWITPDFTENYYAYMQDQIRNSALSAEEIQQQLTEMEEMQNDPFWGSMLFHGLVMFVTVLILGLFVSLVAAGLLSRKEQVVTSQT